MATTYFRVHDPDHDVQVLLDPERQWSCAYSSADERHGISVCRSVEDLAAYLAGPGQGVVWDPHRFVLVEVEADLAEEQDCDARYGVELVHPTRIVSVSPLDEGFFAVLEAAYDKWIEENSR